MTTIKELKEKCKTLGIPRYYKMKKTELEEAIKKKESQITNQKEQTLELENYVKVLNLQPLCSYVNYVNKININDYKNNKDKINMVLASGDGTGRTPDISNVQNYYPVFTIHVCRHDHFHGLLKNINYIYNHNLQDKILLVNKHFEKDMSSFNLIFKNKVDNLMSDDSRFFVNKNSIDTILKKNGKVFLHGPPEAHISIWNIINQLENDKNYKSVDIKNVPKEILQKTSSASFKGRGLFVFQKIN